MGQIVKMPEAVAIVLSWDEAQELVKDLQHANRHAGPLDTAEKVERSLSQALLLNAADNGVN